MSHYVRPRVLSPLLLFIVTLMVTTACGPGEHPNPGGGDVPADLPDAIEDMNLDAAQDMQDLPQDMVFDVEVLSGETTSSAGQYVFRIRFSVPVDPASLSVSTHTGETIPMMSAGADAQTFSSGMLSLTAGVTRFSLLATSLSGATTTRMHTVRYTPDVEPAEPLDFETSALQSNMYGLFRVVDPSPDALYVWDFGDGAYSQGAWAQHSYSEASEYVVELVRIDPATTRTTSQLKVVTVSPSEAQTDVPPAVIALSLQARVTSHTQNMPIESAEVQLNTRVMGQTNADGELIRERVDVRAGHIDVQTHAAGYLPHRRTLVLGTKVQSIVLDTTLTELNTQQVTWPEQNQDDVEVSGSQGETLTLPAGANPDETTSNDEPGAVVIQAVPIAQNGDQSRAVDEQGEDASLAKQGEVYVSWSDASGTPLSAPATLVIPLELIPPGGVMVGDEIQVWRKNAQGVWTPQGVGVVIEDASSPTGYAVQVDVFVQGQWAAGSVTPLKPARIACTTRDMSTSCDITLSTPDGWSATLSTSSEESLSVDVPESSMLCATATTRLPTVCQTTRCIDTRMEDVSMLEFALECDLDEFEVLVEGERDPVVLEPMGSVTYVLDSLENQGWLFRPSVAQSSSAGFPDMAKVTVLDPSGTPLLQDQRIRNEKNVAFIAPVQGRYTITFAHDAMEQGAFRLLTQKIPALFEDTVYQGQLRASSDANAYHVFKTGSSTTAYNAAFWGPLKNAFITILDNDEVQYRGRSIIHGSNTFVAPNTGFSELEPDTYYIVRMNGSSTFAQGVTEDYFLNVVSLNVNQALTLSPQGRSTTSGELVRYGERHYYTLDVLKGDSISAKLRGDGINRSEWIEQVNIRVFMKRADPIYNSATFLGHHSAIYRYQGDLVDLWRGVAQEDGVIVFEIAPISFRSDYEELGSYIFEVDRVQAAQTSITIGLDTGTCPGLEGYSLMAALDGEQGSTRDITLCPGMYRIDDSITTDVMELSVKGQGIGVTTIEFAPSAFGFSNWMLSPPVGATSFHIEGLSLMLSRPPFVPSNVLNGGIILLRSGQGQMAPSATVVLRDLEAALDGNTTFVNLTTPNDALNLSNFTFDSVEVNNALNGISTENFDTITIKDSRFNVFNNGIRLGQPGSFEITGCTQDGGARFIQSSLRSTGSWNSTIGSNTIQNPMSGNTEFASISSPFSGYDAMARTLTISQNAINPQGTTAMKGIQLGLSDPELSVTMTSNAFTMSSRALAVTARNTGGSLVVDDLNCLLAISSCLTINGIEFYKNIEIKHSVFESQTTPVTLSFFNATLSTATNLSIHDSTFSNVDEVAYYIPWAIELGAYLGMDAVLSIYNNTYNGFNQELSDNLMP